MSARVLLAGHCVPCQDRGQVVTAADRTGMLCQFHLRMGARPSSSARSSSPATPNGELKRQWRRAFLSRSPIRKTPKNPGSKRRLSPRRMEEHASLLVVQAVHARRSDRVLAWLALVLYDLDVNRPSGASRVDARTNLARLAAVLAVSADWRSGRRSRPGRQVAAALMGKCEKTVTRHLALLEARGLTECEVDGQLLTAEQRAAAAADEDVSPEQRRRWVNRAEWRLLIPAWVPDVVDVDLWPYVEQAAGWLDELASPARSQAVDGAGDRPVDNRPGQGPNFGNVPPSVRASVLGTLPVRRGSFSCPAAVDKPPAAAPLARLGKGHTGGATRHSPAEEVRKDLKARWTPGAARLARELAADSRFQFIRGLDDVPGLAGVLTALKLGRWTVDDVAAEAELRLYEAGNKPMLTREKIGSPARYLEWLLVKAVPDEPPAQIAAALVESVQAEAAWADALERDAAAQRATPTGGHAQARQVVGAAASWARQARSAPPRRRPRP